MAKIKVELNASYGCDCMGCGYGSEEIVEIEINEQELEALKKIGESEVTCETVMKAIENGETELQSLHERIEEEFYYMVEEYWLYEADNECLYECLEEHIKQDIDDGLYTPETSDDECFDCHCIAVESDDEDEDCYDDDDDCEDEEYDEGYDDEDQYDLDTYYDWVKEHDHEFVAERVGLDLDACRDEEVNYKITLSLLN
jgi:hypothetical protein